MDSRLLTENVYNSLKDDILSSRIKPGERLTELQLADKYNVSRAPVRDAIIRLKQEGLIFVKPQIGTVVSPISLKKAEDVLQVRLLIEPYAAEVAVQKIDSAGLEKLEFAYFKFQKRKTDPEEAQDSFFDLDSELHKTVREWCGNTEIRRILEMYRNEIDRIRIYSSETVSPLRWVPSEEEMEELYEAFRKRIPEKANTSMYKHLSHILENIKLIDS